MASSGAIAAAVVCSLIGVPLVLFLLLFLLKKWMQGPTSGTDNQRRLDDKVVVITGCNTGIGKITAHELSKRGAKVVMLCRNVEKAEAAAEEIRKDTGSVVVVMKCDLSSLESVRTCAAKLIEDEDKIDMLVNNAGVMMTPETPRTTEGFEMQIGTNHLGHFLLTELLLPKLRKSAASGFNARIVIVSSLAHERGIIRFDDINWKNGSYSPIAAYQQSKLANVMHASALARRLENTGITVYSLHPGVIATELIRHMEERYGMLFRCVIPLFNWVIKTPFHGAQTTLYCCLEEKLSAVSGLYYSDCAEKALRNRFATSKDDQEKLWALSEELVGLKK